LSIQLFFRTTLHPEMYHGHGIKPPFFEGWYYKLVNQAEDRRYAIIPGIILGDRAHAFIQVLDGVTGKSTYHEYTTDQFWAAQDRFEIRIGSNTFTRQHVLLDIDDAQIKLSGELNFTDLSPWPVRWQSPGIMGWYAWVPRMECYHGVLSLDHKISGSLQLENERIDFSGGRGYIEKDWGQSFPEAWVWFQTNHFEDSGSCITASVAVIPWLKSAFRGFIIGVWHQKRLYRLATYTGARIDDLQIRDDAVDWVVSDGQYRLEMRATRTEGGLLLGPTRMEMGKRVAETLNATVKVRLSDRSGTDIFQGSGKFAGLEVHGELERLLQL
jgi:hypothetical protein